MKSIIKIVFFSALISHSSAMFSQQEVNFYKQMVEECLSKGDCNKAQIMYESYKDAIGKADVNIEARIKACKEREKPSSTTSNQTTSSSAPSAIKIDNNLIRIKGVVVDKKGEPVIGAYIKLDRSPSSTLTGIDSTHTDIDGRFGFVLDEKYSIDLIVASAGYKDKYIHIYMNDIDIPLRVVLEKGRSATFFETPIKDLLK